MRNEHRNVHSTERLLQISILSLTGLSTCTAVHLQIPNFKVANVRKLCQPLDVQSLFTQTKHRSPLIPNGFQGFCRVIKLYFQTKYPGFKGIVLHLNGSNCKCRQLFWNPIPPQTTHNLCQFIVYQSYHIVLNKHSLCGHRHPGAQGGQRNNIDEFFSRFYSF